MENTATEILLQLKKNEALLTQMVTSQEQVLQIEKNRLATERLQVYTGWAKLVVIVLITWISFVAAQKMITNLTSGMGGLFGGAQTELSTNGDLNQQLKGSQEIIQELLGQ